MGQRLRTPSLPCPLSADCEHCASWPWRCWVEQLSLAFFQPSFMPVETVRQGLQDLRPPRHPHPWPQLRASLTHWPSGENFIVTDFATRDEVIEVSRCGLQAWQQVVNTISYPVPAGVFLSGARLFSAALGRGADQAGDGPHSVY